MTNDISRDLSYLSGSDAEWGNRTYFTYFNEFNRPLEIKVVEVVILALLWVLSVTGNVFAIVVILKNEHLKTITYSCFVNLFLADILFTVGIPIISVTRITETWIFGKQCCQLLMYMMNVCGSVVIWTMVLISIHRYKLVVKKDTRFTRTTLCISLLTIWILPCLLFIPMATYATEIKFVLNSTSSKIVHSCTLVFPNVQISHRIYLSTIFSAVVFIFGFLLPLIILVRNYFKIFRTMAASKKALTESGKFNGSRRPGRSTTPTRLFRQASRSGRDSRAVTAMVVILALFLLLWTPLFAILIAIVYDENETIKSHNFLATVCVALLNGIFNPLTLALINNKFKQGIQNVYQTCCCNRRQDGFKRHSGPNATSTMEPHHGGSRMEERRFREIHEDNSTRANSLNV